MKKTIMITALLLWGVSVFSEDYRSSWKCVELIKDVEKCSLEAYWDTNGYSIGYGHHHNVKKGDRITESKANAYLRKDIEEAERYVNCLLSLLPYRYNFSQNFIDGFTSFVYNVGIGNARESGFYKRLRMCRVRRGDMNKSDWEYALAAVKTSCVTSKGHIERRKREYNLMREK